MRFIPISAVLLSFWSWGFSSYELMAQETAPAPVNAHSVAPSPSVTPAPVVTGSVPRDTEVVPIDTTPEGVDFDFNKVDSVFNSSSRDDSPGLLGKIFLQNRYRYINEDNSVVGDSWQGFDTLLNLPAVTLDTPTPLDVDVFAGYVNMEIHGARWYRPDIKSEAFNIGASIYPSQAAPFRPFLQLGARFIQSQYTSNSGILNGFPWDVAPTHTNRHDTRLVLNAGLEYDIFDSLAYRLTLFAETQDRFEDSAIMNEFILWPTKRIFLRGGITSDLTGSNAGCLVGGGLAF
jgi:hypothetical protein